MAEGSKKVYLAHRSDDGREQTVSDHLIGTARLCREFAESFGAGEYGYLVGMAHDIGKYSDGFQKRLFGGPRVDHSSAGAWECALSDRVLAGMCVAGHHSGLPDLGNKSDMPGDDTFIGRIKKVSKNGRTSAPAWSGRLPATSPPPIFNGEPFALSMWVRMLYSCLVDADFLDTEAFMKNGSVCRGAYDDLTTLYDRLTEYVKKWRVADTEINKLRNRIRDDCINAGDLSPGLFSLTVPTGGGKTISSLSFALKHAITYGKNRIIYVIPYTSIIEQNAAVYRSILGDNNVVEHHSESRLSYSEDLTESQKTAALAAENWDAPIIVTTAVQFFESLYANRPSKCRKLHNISQSVIIFDEAQSIPVGHLLPCMAAIGTLVEHFGVSAVMCSATQPFVTDLLQKYAPDHPVREICDNVVELFNRLKRVSCEDIGATDLYDLASRITDSGSVLCIVNKRKTAKDLFDLLTGDDVYHLSTLMTPEHRSQVLAEIRDRLSDGRPCRVVSTSLIEAGVDIDFPLVYREMTGLDSIAQAAGRCNREGKRPPDESVVSVFSLDEGIPRMLRINVGAAREALLTENDFCSMSAINTYFHAYRSLIGDENLDKSSAVKHLCHGISGRALPYETVSEQFYLIDNTMSTVYIPTDESKTAIDLIRTGHADKNTYRLAGRYCVNIYEDHYKALYEAGDIEQIAPGVAVLVNTDQYDQKTGLSLSADNGRAEFI